MTARIKTSKRPVRHVQMPKAMEGGSHVPSAPEAIPDWAKDDFSAGVFDFGQEQSSSDDGSPGTALQSQSARGLAKRGRTTQRQSLRDPIGRAQTDAYLDASPEEGADHRTWTNLTARTQPAPWPVSDPASSLLTVATAAEALNVSEKTIRRLIERQELPIVRIGRSVRVRATALQTLIERSTA